MQREPSYLDGFSLLIESAQISDTIEIPKSSLTTHRNVVARPLAVSAMKVSMLKNADQDKTFSPDHGGRPSNTMERNINDDERPSRLAIPPTVNIMTIETVMMVLLCSTLW